MAYVGRPPSNAPLTSADIPDGIIVAADLAPNSVDSSELVDGSIDASHLASNIAIITSGAITTTGAFTSVGITDGAVGATAITIDSSEDVTLASDLKLSQAGGILYLGRASDAAQIHRIYSDSGNNLKIGSDLSSGGSISFVPSSTSGAAMTLTSDGKVGIGTNSPTTYQGKVAIVSTSSANETIPLSLVNSAGADDTAVSLGFAPNTNIDLARITALRSHVDGSTDILFKTYNGSSLGDKMRITSAGNVGIGTTAPSSHALLQITGGPHAFCAFECTNSGGRQYEWFSYTDGKFHMYDRTAEAYRMSVSSNGEWAVSDTSPDAISDERLKKNVTTLSSCLEHINSIRGISYNWNNLAKGRDTEKTYYGCIAQELEPYFPELVKESGPDSFENEGSVTGYKTLKLNGLIPVLIEAVKELSAKVTALENA